MELHHMLLAQRGGNPAKNQAWNEVSPWEHEALDIYRHVGWDLVRVLRGVGG
jgi:hypothetical protein